MSLAVARSVDHETWTWSDPELGSSGAWLGLGAFSAIVAGGFGLAWLGSTPLVDDGVAWLLLSAALGASGFAAVSTLVGAHGRMRQRRLAPASVHIDRVSLAWADRRWTWSQVRSIGVGERDIEGGQPVSCVVVLNAQGEEVWLALHQNATDQDALAQHLRAAWTRGTVGASGERGGALRLVATEGADAS